MRNKEALKKQLEHPDSRSGIFRSLNLHQDMMGKLFLVSYPLDCRVAEVIFSTPGEDPAGLRRVINIGTSPGRSIYCWYKDDPQNPQARVINVAFAIEIVPEFKKYEREIGTPVSLFC